MFIAQSTVSDTMEPSPLAQPAEAARPQEDDRLPRLGRAVIYALLVVIPLAYIPRLPVYLNLDGPRRLLLFLGAVILAALLIATWAQRGRFTLRWSPLDRPVLFFFLGGILSAVISPILHGTMYAAFTRLAFWGPVWVQDGLQFLGAGILLFLGIKEFLIDRDDVETAAAIMVMTGGVCAAIGLVDYAVGLGMSDYFRKGGDPSMHRLVGTLGNPMFTGTYLAMLIPLGIGTAMATARAARRWLLLGCTLLLVVPALLFTMARAAWVGIAVAMLVMLVIGATRLRHIQRAGMACLGVLALIGVLAGIMIVSQPALRARAQSFTQMQGVTMKARYTYMLAALGAFVNSPLSGWGVGSMRLVYPKFLPATDAYESGIPINRGFSSALPHNILLQIGAEMGLLGLVPYLLVLATLFACGFSVLRKGTWEGWFGLGVLGMLTANISANMLAFDNAATMALFWAGLGVLGSLVAREATPARRWGVLARPIAPTAQPTVRAMAVVILVGGVIAFGMQWGTIRALRVAIDTMSRLGEPSMSGQAAWDGAVRAEQAAQQALALSPIADYTVYQIWYGTCRALMSVAPGPNERQTVIPRFIAAGEAALRAMPFDPVTLASKFIADMNLGRMDDAREDLKLLRVSQASSAEVFMMESDYFEATKDIPRAVESAAFAAKLDPTYATAHANLGHLYALLVRRADPQADPNTDKMIRAYDDARKTGYDFRTNPPAIYEYTCGLFVRGRHDDALALAVLSPPERLPVLCITIDGFGAMYQMRAEADAFIDGIAASRGIPRAQLLDKAAVMRIPQGAAPTAAP